MRSLLSVLKRIETVFCGLIMEAIVLVTFMQVILRYGFRSPTTWAEELVVFLFIWLSFIGSDLVFKDNRHIAIDTFYEHLKPRTKAILRLLVDLVILVFLTCLAWATIKLQPVQARHVSVALRIPKRYYSLPCFFMSVSMAMSVATDVWLNLFGSRNSVEGGA